MSEDAVAETMVDEPKSDEDVKSEKKASVKSLKKKTTPTVSKKKKKSKQAPSDHPHYRDMIKDALTSLKERGGSSRQAILKYIIGNYKISVEEKTANNHLKMALRAGVKNGTLTQSKGQGASGSFRLGEEKAKKSHKKKETVSTPQKKAKKTASPKKAKKPTPAKKTKKSKPAKKAKSPKKKAGKKSKAKVVKAAAETPKAEKTE